VLSRIGDRLVVQELVSRKKFDTGKRGAHCVNETWAYADL